MKQAGETRSRRPSHTEVLVDGPFAAATLFWRARRGELRCSILAKTAYALQPRHCPLIEPPEPLRASEVPWDEVLAGSIRMPSDLAPFKHSPEVLLVGHAYAPGGRPQKRLAVRLIVGDLDASLEVFPPRRFTAEGALEEPTAAQMPLAYEYAAGGSDSDNPVGIDTNLIDAWGRRDAPSVLPLGQRCDHPSDTVPTVGWGPIAAKWPARTRRLRPEDRAWLKNPTGAPMPMAFDVRFFQSAPHEHWLTGPIRPDERLVLEHLSSAHERLVTNLDGIVPYASVFGARELRVPLIADTLFIDTDRAIVTLTWRGLVLVDEASPSFTVAVARTPGTGVAGPSVRNPTAKSSATETQAAPVDLETTHQQSMDAAIAGTALPFSVPEPGERQPVPDFDDDALPFRTPDSDLSATQQRPAFQAPPGSSGATFHRVDTAPAPARAERPRPPRREAPPPVERQSVKPPSVDRPSVAPPARVERQSVAPPARVERPSVAPPAPFAPQPPPPPSTRAPASYASVSPAPLPAPPLRASMQSSPQLSASPPDPPRPEPKPWSPPVTSAQEPIARPEPKPWSSPVPSTQEPIARLEVKPWSSPVAPVASAVEPAREMPSPPPPGAPMNLRSLSDAAADCQSWVAKPGDRKGEAERPASDLRRHALVDLLAHDAALLPRLRRSAAFAKVLAAPSGAPAWVRPDEVQTDRTRDDRDRMDVLRVLSFTAPADLPRVREIVEEAFDDPAQLELPLVVVTGQLKPSHDDLELLRAAVHAGQPLSASNKALQSALKVVQETIDHGVAPPGDATTALLRQVEQAAGQLWSYISAQIQRTVLEERHFKRRTVLGEVRIRADSATPSGETIPAYVPATVASRLPMLAAFPVVALAELRPREDAQESHADALLVLALGRVVRQASGSGSRPR